jgi:peptidyl-tRNA hydrolase, PTH1 family
MWLVVGLGNPGSQYERTRHNVGFMVVDELFARAGAGPTKNKFGAEISETKLDSDRVLLCKPMEYMNVSGQAVSRIAGFWKIPPGSTLVVHDDLDLPFGRLKLGVGGGTGGHRGLRSLVACLGTPDFCRVRVGVGRPAAGQDPADYVLSFFSQTEQKALSSVVAEASDAVEAIVRQGLTVAMNRFNPRKKEPAGASS